MMKKDYVDMDYHPFTEKLVDAMQKLMPAAPKHMFRCLLAYYFCKVASVMRTNVNTQTNRGIIPVNAFLLSLVPSGIGKNHSTNIIEKSILSQFEQIFLEQVLPIVAEENIAKIAVERAYTMNEDPDTVKPSVITEYENLGKMRFSFENATPAALQQLRQKLLIANAGALSMETDEFGLNLTSISDALKTYLTLFDIGESKETIIKNTRDNVRIEELKGTTPANFLAFGAPCEVFDGGKTEDTLISLEKTGMARRCWNCYLNTAKQTKILTGAERYILQSDKSLTTVFQDAKNHFGQLACITNFNRNINLPKDVGIEWFNYQADCELRAVPYTKVTTKETLRAELEHRYFKVLKYAGALAFVDGHAEITMDNLHAAIKLAEDSGEHFYNMMNQDPAHIRLAKYISAVSPKEITTAEMLEELPYYKKASIAVRKDMLSHAVSWGYKNHIIIKDYMQDGIQFVKGSTLTKTDLNKLILSHSSQLSDGYLNDLAPFDKLHTLTQMKNYNWMNHRSQNGHRAEDCLINGFNMVVLDIDGGIKIETVSALLKDYKFMTYTTKRHTPENHRFRLIMPLNYEMSMNAEEYRVFMRNIFEWLPFEVDTGAVDRCRKWLTNEAGQYAYSSGEQLLDARLFIPKTKRDDERKQQMITYGNLPNLERWFVSGSMEGNRNKQLHRYAMILVDMGYQYDEIRTKVLGLNSSISDKIPESEIDHTIMVTATKAINSRAAKQAA
jgi:hypothetical protein